MILTTDHTSPGPPKLDPSFARHNPFELHPLGEALPRELRAAYDDALDEPLPDAIRALLDKLN